MCFKIGLRNTAEAMSLYRVAGPCIAPGILCKHETYQGFPVTVPFNVKSSACFAMCKRQHADFMLLSCSAYGFALLAEENSMCQPTLIQHSKERTERKTKALSERRTPPTPCKAYSACCVVIPIRRDVSPFA